MNLYLAAWFWAMAVVVVTGALVVISTVGEVNNSIVAFARQGAVWFPFSVLIAITAAYLPVHVAAGLTRRSLALGSLIAAVGTAVVYSAVYCGLLLVERAVFGAFGWQWRILDDVPLASTDMTTMLVSTVLLLVAANVSGLLVGISYQRLGGWWGTLALPLTAGPIVLAFAIFEVDTGPFSTSAWFGDSRPLLVASAIPCSSSASWHSPTTASRAARPCATAPPEPIHPPGAGPAPLPRHLTPFGGTPCPSSRSSTCTSATAAPSPSTTSASRSTAARSSACWAATAPARRPPSSSSAGCARPTRAPSGCSGSTRCATAAGSGRSSGCSSRRASCQPKIGVREALDLYASFYPDPADPAQLLDELGLTDRADARFDQLSGGQKQRLSVALALVGNPQVAILDELTTGLDPQARRDTWEVVERIRARGVTIVLVTHLMEEAERLCDRIALIDAGRVVATGTPGELVARATSEQVLRFRPSAPVPVGLLEPIAAVTHADDGTVEARGRDNVVQDVLVALAQHGIRPENLRLEQSSLEDAFVALTSTRGGLTMSPPAPGPHPPHRRRVPAVPPGAVGRVLRDPLPRGAAHRARPGDAVGRRAVRRHDPVLSQVNGITGYAPTVLALAVATVALSTFPTTIGTYRGSGVLKRLSTTPVRPSRLLVAQVLVNLGALLVAAVLMYVLGALVVGVAAPADPLVLLLALVLTVLAAFAVGSVIAALAPTAAAATAWGMSVYFASLFFAGVWLPLPLMPEVVQTIAGFTPLGAGSEALAAAWYGQPFPMEALLVMVGWTIVGVPVAARYFRWS